MPDIFVDGVRYVPETTEPTEDVTKALVWLWDCGLSMRCKYEDECRTVREQKGGYWPAWSCTRGRFSRAMALAGSAIPKDWPDEWDEEFERLYKNAKDKS